MKILLVAKNYVIFVCFFWLHLSASAQISYEGCRDIRNIAVASISDYSVQDVAVAMLAPNSAPIIRYNPNVLMSLAPQARVFFYMHECGHHALGHNFGTTHPLNAEQDADCFAIRTLVENGMVNDFDIKAIQSELSEKAGGDWSHLPGPQRAINLRECLKYVSNVGRAVVKIAESKTDGEGEFAKVKSHPRNDAEELSPNRYIRPTFDEPTQQTVAQSTDTNESALRRPSTSELTSCTARLRCEIDTLEQICNCRTTIAAIAKEQGLSEAKKMKFTSEKCYSGQYDIRRCWADSNTDLARATCTSVLQDAAKTIPGPTPGSCLDRK